MESKTVIKTTGDPELREAWVETVRERVRRLRFGTVQVVVHEGRVTQIDSTERIRFNQPGARQSS